MFIIPRRGRVRVIGSVRIRGANFRNQVIPKIVPPVLPLLTQGHGESKGAPFPDVVKDELTAFPRKSGIPFHI